MKTKLLLLLLIPAIGLSQVGQGFENTPGVSFFSGTCQYFDADNVTVHELANYNAPCGLIYVTESTSGAVLGYTTTLDPTTPNGPNGFSDGDFFGVGTAAFFTSEIAAAPPEGSQAFFMEDPDGTVTMSFDSVDLSGTSNPQFSMQYILEATSWELDDFLRVTISITDCASSTTVTVLDTAGQDIDNLGIEDVWNTLNSDLTAYVGCNAALTITFSSNSAAEELGLDNIQFTAGMTLGANEVQLANSISVSPNPSNGNITVKNTGNALESIVVTDINGRQVSRLNLNGTSEDVSIDLSNKLSSGLYFMTISTDRESTIKKVIIK
ncbi:T9SS type A sorting domain-containing protein [Psychroserpens sp.]|uniref:T9SS type A sorting domain-containing protein n=1 Tax=Psychroserpens sp. TaxID=2020870 RepID=UPI001B02DEDF|nr:T9SS type A sorting domain-containing protein [Psychroserpens sp.]MBO6605641.1 T9SS type A sorting domain-containing protein [Psychroserpens sp.]MBO6630687.1 T9SS type A sorting domain-containing protein [Psychroserpens sp.]MBO6653550.1 T9SS type A sorting domain-containing protein [Psychroserpens sp.]MBO6681871.1 T9SS type A sorting domain-containing protein [Psychroserpens sp.]MBO6749015.1 T9SS type A sorting domain-containing protein [Psychroserpens sp.]